MAAAKLPTYVMEAARAASIAAHAAAGLADQHRCREGARLLRAAEAAGRAAFAVLANVTKVQAELGESTAAPVVARRARRRRRKSKRDLAPMEVEMVKEPVVPSVAAAAPSASRSPTRSAAALLPRERSPRRDPSRPPSVQAQPCSADRVLAWQRPGVHARLGGLDARPDLNGSLVELCSWLPGDGRWAAKLQDTGAMVKVTPDVLHENVV